AVLAWSISRARARVLDNAHCSLVQQHEALEEAHGRLRTVHDKMVGQDKLAALGVMSAGIAHEINNPMSVVTANIEALMADLPSLPQDATLLDEYRTDVLPSTLDGVRRVNAIVADLRRFARAESR